MRTTTRSRPARLSPVSGALSGALSEAPSGARSRAGWLVPLLVALVTVALLGGVHVAFTPGDGGGGGPDVVPAPQIPTAVAQAVAIGPETATIEGYAATSDGFWLDLTVQTLTCAKLVVEPRVTETDESVTVSLLRAPGPDRQLFACPTRPYPQRVLVPLPAGLGGRPVVDGSDGRAVPKRL